MVDDKLWNAKNLMDLVLKQLNNFFYTKPSARFEDGVHNALRRVEESLSKTTNRYFLESGFSPYHSAQYSIFLYYLSHDIGGGGMRAEADQVYYLNKIMNSVDWYWAIQLPNHFFVEHPLGSILGRASYGDYISIYQGVTIGGNRKGDHLYYPVLGDYTILYANSKILGKCNVGNYVIISADACIKDEDIPDYSIVFGTSPHLIIKNKGEEEMRKMMKCFWA